MTTEANTEANKALVAEYMEALRWYWRPAPRDLGREFGNAAG